ncbi:hypothetical protein CRENPOLYSF2_4510002 [Crenothrix polyspora]|uniref:Calcium-binding protein n=1 Tax=Crenothrix polyspora TaxID=360316 RepID=A0A1R4HFM2_9GAMM|nr:calcium-binding protein [Crenothrix polyspora]SJM95038.1 hypothetical protein CRENPOLYSF2_4510002 [Crenothrix polyspora]
MALIPKNISKSELGTTADVFGTATTDDYLLGTSSDDIISGGIAAIAYTADGIDIMQGGAGDDRYIVNNTTGFDVIIEYANEGTDTVFSSVNYTLPSEVENIVATGDELAAPAGAILTGNILANILDGSQSSQADKLKGMEGNDTYILGTGDKIVEGRAGTGTVLTYSDTGGVDTIVSHIVGNIDLSTTAGQEDTAATGAVTTTNRTVTTASIVGVAYIENVTLDNAAGAVNITGNVKNNTLTGNNALNTIDGGAGNDILDGGTNSSSFDTLVGGMGNDTYIKRNALDVITEATSAGTDTVISNLTVNMTSTPNIENITLTGISAIDATGNASANLIKGNSGANTLTGGAGNDFIYGLQGNDTLVGGTGNDIMIGGRGNDVYTVDSTGDVASEAGGDGTDRVESSVSYALTATAATNIENLTLTGTGSVNATGNAQPNILTGNAAVNILNGGSNADDMQGGLGSDTYIVDNEDTDTTGSDTADTVTDTGGTADLIQSSVTFDLATGGNAGVDTGVEKITLTGTANIGATGNASANTITGNIGNNSMAGGAGDDKFIGNGGLDTINGEAGNDTITGGTGQDTVTTGDMTPGAAGTGEQDTIVFAAGVADTSAATSVAGIDLYLDLVLNEDINDQIDLTVVVANVNGEVTGNVSGATFIANMNSLLNVGGGNGFNTAIAGDISAAVVTVGTGGGGVADGDKFLAVDLDKSGTFTATDFVIEITGSNITNFDASSFI